MRFEFCKMKGCCKALASVALAMLAFPSPVLAAVSLSEGSLLYLIGLFFGFLFIYLFLKVFF